MKPRKPLYLALVLSVVLTQMSFGQTANNVTLLANYGIGEGDSKAVFAAGSIVFYGLGNKVQIASFSNPAAPVKIGSVILSDVVEALVRTSIGGVQHLVVSGGSKMWIINVQNPSTPSLVSTTDVAPGTVCEGIATSGSYAYIAAGAAGFKVYNIATPAAPVPVASVDSLAYCENVVISAPYAFIAADGPGYVGRSFIFDISNPAAPVYKSTILGYGGYHQYMSVRSGYAFICDYNTGLQVINVADVTHPVNVVAIPSGFSTASIVFDGNYAYVAVGTLGLFIYDVSTPSAPVFVTSILTGGRAAFVSYGAITIGGVPKGHIYVSNRDTPGCAAINVSDPAHPALSGNLTAVPAASGIAYCPFYSNGKVYVAYGAAGLRILDVSNPTSAALVSTTALGGDSRAVAVSGNYAYVAALDSGLYVIDVTNAANPAKLNTLKIPRANGLAFSGNYLYVAAGDSGLAIIDITTPATPVLMTYSRPGGQTGENVALAGNVLGLTDYTKILFFDLTTPAAPVGKGTTSVFRIGDEGFAIAGNYAYVPDGDTLKIFGIANLLAPALVSSIYTGGYGYMASVAGNYCYVASEATGVRAINITNPASPTEAGFYDGVPQSRGVTANGAYIYAAEKTDGLSVYRNDVFTSVGGNTTVPMKFDLLQNYPNPFNPTTNIAIELPERAFVSLEVYNILGQRVAVLLHGQMPGGSFTVPFNASALPSGMYFYRMRANSYSSVRKMLVVK
jgi:hypothetical protein